MPRRRPFALLPLLAFAFLLMSSHAALGARGEVDVVIFFPGDGKYANGFDVRSYEEIAKELRLSARVEGPSFINDRSSFFREDGTRKFQVLVLPGGEPHKWFSEFSDEGIDCRGSENILEFVRSGGSVLSICLCGSSIFATRVEWVNPHLDESRRHEWDREHEWKGTMYAACGLYAFRGTIKGPQESNRPYPKTLYLPIEMNMEHDIVKRGQLPPVIHMIVVGGGSILPAEGQPLEVVGRYPNGTPAIGVVPYGDGRIILSNPHPNITGRDGDRWRRKVTMGEYAEHWGWTDEMISEGKETIKSNPDADGRKPDWALAKAMLLFAHEEASKH